MSYTSKTLVKALLLSLAISACGIAFIWSVYLAKHDGEVVVHKRRTPSFTAYASGASASDFQAEITKRLITGTILLTGGVGTLLALVLLPPTRRQQFIEAASRSSADHQERLAIRWSAFTWITIAIAVLVLAVVLRI